MTIRLHWHLRTPGILADCVEGQALQAVDDWGDVDKVVARVVREAQKRQWRWRWFLLSGRREGWWKAGINGSQMFHAERHVFNSSTNRSDNLRDLIMGLLRVIKESLEIGFSRTPRQRQAPSARRDSAKPPREEERGPGY